MEPAPEGREMTDGLTPDLSGPARANDATGSTTRRMNCRFRTKFTVVYARRRKCGLSLSPV